MFISPEHIGVKINEVARSNYLRIPLHWNITAEIITNLTQE